MGIDFVQLTDWSEDGSPTKVSCTLSWTEQFLELVDQSG